MGGSFWKFLSGNGLHISLDVHILKGLFTNSELNLVTYLSIAASRSSKYYSPGPSSSDFFLGYCSDLSVGFLRLSKESVNLTLKAGLGRLGRG